MAGRNMTDAAVSVADNNRMITQALKTFSAPAINTRDPDAVAARIQEYFQSCRDLELRPGNMGLYAALGLSRQDVHDAFRGANKSKLSPASIDMLKKATRALAAYREQLGATGRINPVTLIFWQKNFDGFEDQHRIELDASDRNVLQASLSPEEIARRIEQDIPIDDGILADVREPI